MKAATDSVNISIMGKDFMIACPDDERGSLVAAANYLEKKMQEIHDTGKVIGAERCAIMAALNIANDLLDAQNRDSLLPETTNKIRSLQKKIDTVLHL